MPIVINTINDKEYIVSGDYSLDEFRRKHMSSQDDYIKFDAEIGREVIPTYVMRGSIVAIHEFSEQEQNEYEAKAFFD